MKVESIFERLYFSTVYIETLKDGNTFFGTGFYFVYITEDGKEAPFLVTNRHVIDGYDFGTVMFTRRGEDNQPIIGERVQVGVKDFQERWTRHIDEKVDIAVMPMAPILKRLSDMNQSPFLSAITREIIPTQEQIDSLDAIEEILFIGYPDGIFDRKNLLPVARRGITATPIQIDYNGRPCFLVDAFVFGGSSGSPVFIANQGGFASRGGFNIGSRIYFLGVVTEVHTRDEAGVITIVDNPVAGVPVPITRQYLNLGIVFKAQSVIETIEECIRRHHTT